MENSQNHAHTPAESDGQNAHAPKAHADASTDSSVVPQITQKQAKRINAPARNMIISMLAMVAILIPVLWLMPQPDKNPYRPQVNLSQVAAESTQQAGFPVAVPQLESWHYNYARWTGNTPDNIPYFKSGQVTSKNHFIELIQAKDTNPTWVAQQVDNAAKQGTESISGVEWEVRSATSKKNNEKVYSYVAQVPHGNGETTTVILTGTADPAEFAQLADATVAYMKAPTMTTSPGASNTSNIS